MKDEEFGKLKNVLFPSLVSSAIALGVLVTLLFTVTAVIYKTADPCKFADVSSILIMLIPSFLAGFIGAKKAECIPGGIISGAVLTLIIMMISLFFKNSGNASALSGMPYSLIIRSSGIAAVLIGSVLSSYFTGRNKNKNLGVRMPKIKKYR